MKRLPKDLCAELWKDAAEEAEKIAKAEGKDADYYYRFRSLREVIFQELLRDYLARNKEKTNQLEVDELGKK